MNIREFRTKHPEYDDLDDNTLSEKLHAKSYSDIPYDEFKVKFGVVDQTVSQEQSDQSDFTPDVVTGGDTRDISHGSSFSKEGGSLPGFVEPVATLATAALAEPVAGVAGIAGAFNTPQDPNDPYVLNPRYTPSDDIAKPVSATREALTYQPKTELGQEVLSDVGGLLTPVAEFMGSVEEGLGDSVFESTGSPALAALATTAPTAVMELIGVAAGRSTLAASRKLKKGLSDGKIMREIDDAVPTIDNLKEASSGLYKEIDEMGVSVKSDAYGDLVNKISRDLHKSGLDGTITPKAQQALARLDELVGQDIPLSEIDLLRKVAGNAAGAIEKTEAALGMKIINHIDDFLDNSNTNVLNIPQQVDRANVGKRYRIARDMWGRARRSELIEEAFYKARLQASGFENGIRTQFRSLLNNKKSRKLFKPDEMRAIEAVVNGSNKQNLAKLIGKLGFTEGGSTNFLGGSIGAGAGFAGGGVPGAVIVPLVGQVSKKLAQRMTVAGAEFADQVIRSGSNARKITRAYLKNTPKAQRSAQELSELLTRNDIDLVNLPNDELAKAAAKIANNRRAELAGAVTAASSPQDQSTQ